MREAREHDGVAKALLGGEQQASAVERAAFPLGLVQLRLGLATGLPAVFVIAPTAGVIAQHEAGEAVVPAEIRVAGIVVEGLAVLHEGLGYAVLFLQNPAEVDGGLGGVRRNHQLAFEASLGGGKVTQQLV